MGCDIHVMVEVRRIIEPFDWYNVDNWRYIPVDDPKYHVTTQKRPLAAYAKVGGSGC